MARTKSKKKELTSAEREQFLAQLKLKNVTINDRDQKISKLKAEITSLNRRLMALNAVVASNNLSDAREKIVQLESQVKRLQNRIKAKDEYITLLRITIKLCDRCKSLRHHLITEKHKKVFHINEPSTSSVASSK